ncbi:MAG TPA: class I SAM-dependent methyltransferase [Candidatus Limnocylindria bacterium]|nr:class I SAM-dependent methyltransferase [Candidatus Limnocylindria bacterium]
MLSKIASGEYPLEAVPRCVCGASGGIELAGHDRYGLPVGVLLCATCGLARTSPRLAAEVLGRFYQEDYHALHQSVETPEAGTALFREGQGRAIADYLGDRPPLGSIRVADIGCGTGQVLREFQAALGPERVTAAGCEYAAAFVEAGRAAGSDIRQGGPETLLGSAPFDVVILSHVVEHFPDPVADLELIRRLGNERSLFYVEVPGLLTIDQKAEYAFRFDQYLTLAHTYHFTLSTLAATMARAGFTLIEGDERVRSIFRSAEPTEPVIDPSIAVRVLESRANLGRLSNRARGAPVLLRQRLAALARRLPEPAYARLRQLARR